MPGLRKLWAAAGIFESPMTTKQRLEPNPSRPTAYLLGAKWLWGGLGLVALVLLAYLPAIGGGSIWDDDSWTTKVAGLLRNASGLRSIWFSE